jgi:hypothetical protein
MPIRAPENHAAQAALAEQKLVSRVGLRLATLAQATGIVPDRRGRRPTPERGWESNPQPAD